MRASTIVRIAILAIALGIAWFIRGQLIESSHRRFEENQWVKLIDEPPPPPPEEEPLPEPEPIPEPETAPLQEEIEKPEEIGQSTDDVLGADEEGQAGSDSFGIRSKKGGRDLLQSGPSGHQGLLFLAYGGDAVDRIQRKLASDRNLREKSFVAVVRVWITPRGMIERAEIEQSTGNLDTDHRLIQALLSFSGTFPAPPPGLPQPLRIRLTSKMPSG